jgi:choice-of-anchor B domain-containing protein
MNWEETMAGRTNKKGKRAGRIPPRALDWCLGGAFCALLVAGFPLVASADQTEKVLQDPSILGHSGGGDLEVKRVAETGKGMPSVAGPFPDTDNMDFLGQLTNEQLGVDRLIWSGAAFLSDIWGWTSPVTGDEYALIGTTSGVAFARITDGSDPGAAKAPEFLGMIPTTDTGTQRNWWWDLRTYNDHVYYVTEVNGAGVAIFDLKNLDGRSAVEPGSAESILEAGARYTGNGYLRAHNIAIHEATGMAYVSGASKVAGVDPAFTDDGVIILDLANPLAPVEVGTIVGEDIDSHDMQVVTYNGPDKAHVGKPIGFISNGGALNTKIYDVSDPAAPVLLSTVTHPGASFAHQGWPTDGHEFFIFGDEEDELFGLQDPRNSDLPDTARTYILDIRDLDDPQLHGFFDSPAASIDHNLFVKGDKVYQANYTAGMRVLQITPTATGIELTEAGHMDTEPRLPNNNLNFNFNIFAGPWGVFPFFDSGKVIASDGFNGLIVARLSE